MPASRLHWVLFAMLAGLVLVSGAGDFVTGPGDQPDTGSPTLVEPVANGSSFWPYTSRTRSFETRRLGINLLVRGDPVEVRRYFLRHTDDDWRRRSRADPPDSGPAAAAEVPGVAWRLAHGAPRYTYIERETQRGDGEWVAETYQLYEGSYLGTRYHLRAYASPDGDWTAIQAHQEHWDWFGLRHTVTSTEAAQRHVEADLGDDAVVESVGRMNLGNGGAGDSDGWATVIEFAAIGFLFGGLRSVGGRADAVRRSVWATIRSPRGKRALRQGSLFAAVGLVYLGVRVAGVTLEEAFPAISPVVIAGGLYPVLAVGLPSSAGYFGRRVRMEPAFLLAVAGFLTALVLDLWYLGLSVIPIRIALHRLALLLSLGLVAAGAAYREQGGPRWNVLLQIGLVGWVFALGLPVLGLV